MSGIYMLLLMTDFCHGQDIVPLTVLFVCSVECSDGVFTESSGVLSSMDFPFPYPKSSDCVYRIEVEPGFRLRLQFDLQFDVEDHPDISCPYDHVMVNLTQAFVWLVHTENNHKKSAGEQEEPRLNQLSRTNKKYTHPCRWLRWKINDRLIKI